MTPTPNYRSLIVTGPLTALYLFLLVRDVVYHHYVSTTVAVVLIVTMAAFVAGFLWADALVRHGSKGAMN